MLRIEVMSLDLDDRPCFTSLWLWTALYTIHYVSGQHIVRVEVHAWAEQQSLQQGSRQRQQMAFAPMTFGLLPCRAHGTRSQAAPASEEEVRNDLQEACKKPAPDAGRFDE